MFVLWKIKLLKCKVFLLKHLPHTKPFFVRLSYLYHEINGFKCPIILHAGKPWWFGSLWSKLTQSNGKSSSNVFPYGAWWCPNQSSDYREFQHKTFLIWNPSEPTTAPRNTITGHLHLSIGYISAHVHMYVFCDTVLFILMWRRVGKPLWPLHNTHPFQLLQKQTEI